MPECVSCCRTAAQVQQVQLDPRQLNCHNQILNSRVKDRLQGRSHAIRRRHLNLAWFSFSGTRWCMVHDRMMYMQSRPFGSSKKATNCEPRATEEAV